MKKALIEVIRKETGLAKAPFYHIIGWSRQRYDAHLKQGCGLSLKKIKQIFRALGPKLDSKAKKSILSRLLD